MRLESITITVLDDAAGKPYVQIEGSDPSTASPIRIVLWAKDIKVADHRRPKTKKKKKG